MEVYTVTMNDRKEKKADADICCICWFVPHSKKSPKLALMCNYKFDPEHGIAIVFENGKYKEIGEQDIIV